MNRSLDLGFQCTSDPFKHEIESGKLSYIMIRNLNRYLLEHPKHGSFSNRPVFSFKGIVHGQVLDGGLKQDELIGDKRIGMDEVVLILEIPVKL